MRVCMIRLAIIGAAVVMVPGVMLVDDGALKNGELTLAKAHAVRGRPATPVSYAGVARRTTRRVVAVGSTRTCVQKVDAYGRIVTVCN
jgi:hypothetical protein